MNAIGDTTTNFTVINIEKVPPAIITNVSPGSYEAS